MSTNAREFALQLEDFAERVVPEAAAQFQRAVCLEAVRRIVMRSPVDTGRFRGNWRCSQGEPIGEVLDTVDPDGGATIAAGMAVIDGITQPGEFWMANNLPYAVPLDNGHSKQAPAGIVAVTLAELRAAFGGAP